MAISSTVLTTGCSKDQEDRQVLATVDDSEITVSDFEQDYVEYLIKTGRNDTRDQRYRFLNEMIDNLVLADEAIGQNYLSNPVYQDAIWYQKRKSLADLYFVDQMNERLEAPSDDEIRKAYAKSKRKVYVRHLFSKDKDKLNRYYQELEQGEDFVDVANEFYETQEYDSTAGYLGPITYFGIDENFAETAFSLNEGEFSKPIRTSFGYHIVYVEKVIRQAMLIESEYQVRKQGIENKLKQRRQALQANSYIRNLMGSLDVQMNREVLVNVMEEIQNLPSVKNIEQEKQADVEAATWNDRRLEELKLEVANESVLGTYVLMGERHEFTVQDYLYWLPYLPLNESRNRTGASVGRAMRNEVLMQLSQAKGYEEDERLENLVRKRGNEVLSDLYQQKLIQEALQDTTEMEISDEFKRKVVRSRSFNLETSYWKVPATSREEAELIRREIAAGAPPQSFPNYQFFEDITLSPSESDYAVIDEVRMGTPLVTKANLNQWAVINVKNRAFVETTPEDSTDRDLDRMYRVYTYLNKKVDSLRSETEITINRELFDEIYDL
ncbi:peptidylprolyl isomerase [Gracilimonas sediminicola]|uniref:Peptidylprolyl isomerase n=1 Tax=Gracilimonas sediminicola TaxID=2952158 RepID=A0A9X2L5X6_9BACT|nr:peptidylprolyl isomerase [Gracilimonas sediminicola]MCP9292980.1 peptidylprolyl isomerase [Gracilimonas sediminicola]